MTVTVADFFTDTEVRTLEALYPDRERWFEFLWVLSDAVSERNWEAGEFLRWLCPQKQRPFWNVSGDWAQWWTLTVDDSSRFNDKHYANYLPLCFDLIAWCGPDRATWPTSTEALCAAMALWCEFDPETRQRLWTEWVPNANGR